MPENDTVYLTLPEARAMIDRGVAKARALRQAGSIAVLDAAGVVVSISRMDDGPASSVEVARSKAYLAAVHGRPSAGLAFPARLGQADLAPASDGPWRPQPPVAGGMPVMKGGRAVGGIAAGDGIDPYTQIPGVDPALLLADGVQGNAEDLVICAALAVSYRSQHGDQMFTSPWSSTEAPTQALPLGLEEARRLADRAMEYAVRAELAVGVAVVDELGRLIQVDRMDGSPLGSAALAEAKAMTALKFQRPGSTLTAEFRGHSARLRAIERLLNMTILALGGGMPIRKGDRLVGAMGVSGSGASNVPGASGGRDEEIALAALADR